MDLTELEIYLDQIVESQCVSAEIIEWLATQAERSALDETYWKALEQLLGKEAAAVLREAYRSAGHVGFCKAAKTLAKSERRGIQQKAKKRLKTLTKLSFRGSLGDKLIAIRNSEGLLGKVMSLEDLLRVAFAYQLVDLIEPASGRAALFTEVVVKMPTSPEAEKYLEEAYYCFFYGLNTACAITCRSVLEEAIERKLPPDIVKKCREINPKKGPTLGQLIVSANENKILPSSAHQSADTVLAIGNKAAHQQPVTKDEALNCLTAARKTLGLLLQSFL